MSGRSVDEARDDLVVLRRGVHKATYAELLDRFEAAIRAQAVAPLDVDTAEELHRALNRAVAGATQRALELRQLEEQMAAVTAERDRALGLVEEAKEGLGHAEAWLKPLLCDDDVTICQHPACEAWVAVGLTRANISMPAPATEEVQG